MEKVEYFERDREVSRESTRQRIKFYVGKRKERKNNGGEGGIGSSKTQYAQPLPLSIIEPCIF